MKEQYFTFMQKIFDPDHAEIVPQENLRPEKRLMVPTSLRLISP